MKKTLLSATVAVLLSSLSMSLNATNLLEAYQDAVKNDPSTLKAKAQYDIARESENIAFSNLLPSLNFSTTYRIDNGENYSDPVIVESEVNSLSYGLTLSQTIFKMGDWYNLDSSEQKALQAQAGYDLAQQSLIVRVTNAYFNVLKAKDNFDFVTAEKNAIARQLEQTKQRFNVGLTAITDVHEAQANYDLAVASEIRSRNNIELAKEALREITGNYYREFDGLNKERFTASLPSPLKVQDWVNQAQSSNLELKIKELAVSAAKNDIKAGQSGHYPTLGLMAGISSSDKGGDLEQPALNSNYVSLQLNLPIYTGGATSAGVRQAQAAYVLASEDMELTHRSIVRQTRSSYADVVALVSTLNALDQSVVSAESALKATQAGFEVGTRTIVDVLNSTRNLYNAKQNLANSRYDYILAMLSLKQAAGTLTLQDIESVNSGLEN